MLECLDEIGARIDTGNVLEYLIVREMLAQIMGKPAHHIRGVLATVADEDTRRARRRTSRQAPPFSRPSVDPRGRGARFIIASSRKGRRAARTLATSRSLSKRQFVGRRDPRDPKPTTL